MKNRIALLAVALSFAAAAPAFADNPADAPLVIESRAPEIPYPQTAQHSERKASKKERRLKAQQAKQPSTSQATAQQSGSGMH